MAYEGECLVRKAGMNEQGRLRIELRDPGTPGRFEYTWYSAPAALQREYLSIAMTAITSNKRVFCKMERPGVDNDPLLYFGLVKG